MLAFLGRFLASVKRRECWEVNRTRVDAYFGIREGIPVSVTLYVRVEAPRVNSAPSPIATSVPGAISSPSTNVPASPCERLRCALAMKQWSYLAQTSGHECTLPRPAVLVRNACGRQTRAEREYPLRLKLNLRRTVSYFQRQHSYQVDDPICTFPSANRARVLAAVLRFSKPRVSSTPLVANPLPRATVSVRNPHLLPSSWGWLSKGA